MLNVSENGFCLLNWAQSTELARTEKHKFNLTQRLLVKPKLAHHTFEEVQKICWKQAKVLQIEPNTTYRKYKESGHMFLVDHQISQPSLSIPPDGLSLSQQNSENYNPFQGRLCEKIVFLCWYHTEKLSL
jgi:hypothetical protein